MSEFEFLMITLLFGVALKINAERLWRTGRMMTKRNAESSDNFGTIMFTIVALAILVHMVERMAARL